jgi:DNA invertase Pin-like site-specific DNA recombinase
MFKGQGDMTSQIMATILGLVAQIERDFISSRTKEALAKLKAQGKTLGRKKGVKLEKTKLDKKENEIKKYLEIGINKRAISKLVECSPSTLYAWLKKKGLYDKEKEKKSVKKP